jgi:hypothetical protein
VAVKKCSYCKLFCKCGFYGKYVVLNLKNVPNYNINGYIQRDSVEGEYVKLYTEPEEGCVKAIVCCNDIIKVTTDC